MPHKVQVQAATVVGLGESRVVQEVLFSEEQGTVCVCVEVQLHYIVYIHVQYVNSYSI